MVGKGGGRANLYIDLDNFFLRDLRGKSLAGRKWDSHHLACTREFALYNKQLYLHRAAASLLCAVDHNVQRQE